MFPSRYFPTRYYPPRYYPHSTPAEIGAGYYPGRYYPGRYYPGRYYPIGSVVSVYSIRQSVAAALAADAGVAAIAGSNVFPIFIPETVFLESQSALAYHFLGNTNGQLLTKPNGLSRARVKFIAESKNYSACDQILEAVRQLFDGYSGPLPGGIACLGAFQADDDDLYTEPDDATDRGTFTIETEYTIHYRLTKPKRFT